jgi:predicted nucleic acid-binding protein
MRKPKIYLETTIFNHYFDAERDAHADTVKMFKEIQTGKYEAYTSSYVIDELAQAAEPKRSNMLALIAKYNINVLDANDEAQDLANVYVNEGVIPTKYKYDGLHIAIATINDLEYIFSLNFKHINKVKTKTMTSLINVRHGYKPILIATPMEVTDDDENK